MSLKAHCTPRESVFDRSRRDVVLNLSDLLEGKLDEGAAQRFFEENYLTAGMKTLVEKSFDRLLGRRDQAATFLLSQAMGGGKTHSMLALGLLGRFPQLRKGIHKDLGDQAIRVIGFDGRESDYPYGIWGALAEGLHKRDHFKDLYSPLQAPGVSSWIGLLKGEPTLILLDELPPYLHSAKAKSVGSSNLAEVSATALANLLVAVNKAELSNVVVVISDLSGTAYHAGGELLNEAVDNLAQEANRSAVRIEPVATVGDEVYHILRTRLFKKLPDAAVRDRVATAYAEAVKKAKQMDLTAETPESFASQLRDSYPFHFALRDLYGRFKANPGFQQTRGLLRLMRTVVADLWESGVANRNDLIHPYDIDLNKGDVFSEFASINGSLTEAVREDIANNGASHAEELDRKLGGTMAQDAAKLIYVSSLSSAQNAVIGLRDSETIAWLCVPGRDMARVRTDILETLPNLAWYLHLSTDGRLYYKSVANLNARLHSLVGSYNRETKLKQLSGYLTGIFKPNLGDVYQDLKVLPAWDELSPTVDRCTLVVTEPHPGSRADAPLHPDWIRFYDQLELKNRILFLTGDRDTMEEVLKNAALYRAIQAVLGEMESQGVGERDPQKVEARTSEAKFSLALRSAVQQTFSQVVYPSEGGLRTEHIRLNFNNNNFDAEAQIREALKGVQKFSDDTRHELWAEKIKSKLFDGQNPVVWNEIRKRAAVKPKWQFHHPRLFEEVRSYALRMGLWREEGASIRVGPFPAEPTAVVVREKSRNDETGTVVLEIKPVGGTKVIYEIGETRPGASAEPVPSYDAFETTELSLSFLCVDEGPTEAQAGEHRVWRNRITLKSRLFQQGDSQFCELVAAPKADILYTTNGSDPRTHGASYDGPFPVPAGTRLIMAVAKRKGVESDVLRRDVDQTSQGPDPAKPLVWKTHRHFQNRPSSEAWQLIERMESHKAQAEGVTLCYMDADGREELTYTSAENLPRTGAEIRSVMERLTAFFEGGNISLSVNLLRFDRGQDFLDWIGKDRIAVDQDRELRQ